MNEIRTAEQAAPARPARRRLTPARLAYVFYGTAAAGATVGQVWVALERIPWDASWPIGARVAVVLPFALCLELLAMVLAAMADERQRLGERAYGLRVMSAVVATLAIGIILVGHWPHLYQVAAFGALSGSAYALWLLHSGARRRDALRATGQLAATAPAYGVRRWLPIIGHPLLTARAAELAREHGLGLYASLRAAERAAAAEQRRPALARAVEQAVRADHDDPLRAEIEARTLDLDALAAELESRADYSWWADRLTPARTATPDTTATPAGDIGGDIRPDTAGDIRGGRPRQRPTRRGGRGSGHGPAMSPGAIADRVGEVLAQSPDITRAELARRVGTSPRHLRRVLGPVTPDRPDTAGDIGGDIGGDMSPPVNGHPAGHRT